MTIQYTKWSSKVTAKKDQDVKLPCSVQAFPLPNMAWKRDGELVTNDSRHVVTRKVLKILQVSSKDMGGYYCIAWNRGSVQAKETLLLITGTCETKSTCCNCLLDFHHNDQRRCDLKVNLN